MRSRIATVLLVSLALAASAFAQEHRRLFRPEDLGLLEGPDRAVWQRPDQIMDELAIYDGSRVADIGAGGGWFTIRLAHRVGPNGRVYAEDTQRQMIETIKLRVEREGLRNVVPWLGESSDPLLPPNLDALLINDVYHEFDQPVVVLRNILGSLKPKGRVGIVGFNREGGGPGPPIEDRVDPERIIRDAEAAGFRLIARPSFLRYQYMLVFERPETTTR